MTKAGVSFTPAGGGASGDLTDVDSVMKADLKIGEDAQTMVDFETANEIHFDADNAEIAKITSTGLTMASEENIYLDAGSIHADSTPGDEKVSGITATFTAGEDLVRGEVGSFKASDSKLWTAVATASETSRCVAMAAADIAADAAGVFLMHGFLEDNGSFPSYTIGGVLFTPEAEQNSENVPEQAAPDTDGDFVQTLGWAVTANMVYFCPSLDVIEHA